MIHEVLQTAVQVVKGLSTGASVDGKLPDLAPASVDSIRPLQCRPVASRTRRSLAWDQGDFCWQSSRYWRMITVSPRDATPLNARLKWLVNRQWRALLIAALDGQAHCLDHSDIQALVSASPVPWRKFVKDYYKMEVPERPIPWDTSRWEFIMLELILNEDAASSSGWLGCTPIASSMMPYQASLVYLGS